MSSSKGPRKTMGARSASPRSHHQLPPAGSTGDDRKPKLPSDRAGDDFAYLVATHAWRDGLTANAIVKKLGLKSEPRNLMQVKRALKRAHARFLKLVPPEDRRTKEALDERINVEERRVRVLFHVVDDKWGPKSGPVFSRAATLVSEIIADLAGKAELARKKAVQRDSNSIETSNSFGRIEPDVVICNAGGRAVSEMVKALARDPPVLSESDEEARRLSEHLLFVAGNAAYLPDSFQLSANFLSVSMAELFGAAHQALPIVENDLQRREHERRVENAALFICGAGSCTPDRQSGLMALYCKQHGWTIPPNAVGDIAFNLLDRNGFPVRLDSSDARDFMSQVNPALSLDRLMHIAVKNRVLLILDSPQPEQKKLIGAAALKREYATDVVLGASLAREILHES